MGRLYFGNGVNLMINMYDKVGSRREHHKVYVQGSKYLKRYKKEVYRRNMKFKRNWRKLLKAQIVNK